MYREGRKVLVLITDGGDTTSKADYQAALHRAATIQRRLFTALSWFRWKPTPDVIWAASTR